MEQKRNIAWTFARLYSSPGTLAMGVALFGFYWVLFYELIKYAGEGFFLVAVPLPLLVLFVLSSSVLATVSIAYLRSSTRRRRGAVGVAQSPLTLAAGTAVVTCACNIPLLGPLLYAIGMNSLSVSAVISSLAQYQEPLVLAMIGLNALSACYYLRLIGATGGRTPRSRPRPRDAARERSAPDSEAAIAPVAGQQDSSSLRLQITDFRWAFLWGPPL